MNQTIAAMREAVEKQEKCKASHFESRTVKGGRLGISRAVETFALSEHHSGIKWAYVWVDFRGEEKQPHFSIKLGEYPVISPEAAVHTIIGDKIKNIRARLRALRSRNSN
jgi:hypothetical protein